jgi:hypothetical protein
LDENIPLRRATGRLKTVLPTQRNETGTFRPTSAEILTRINDFDFLKTDNKIEKESSGSKKPRKRKQYGRRVRRSQRLQKKRKIFF